MCYDFQSLYNLEYILSFFLVHIVSYPLKVKQLIKGGKNHRLTNIRSGCTVQVPQDGLNQKVFDYTLVKQLCKKRKRKEAINNINTIMLTIVYIFQSV